jgi:hypothetical protein
MEFSHAQQASSSAFAGKAEEGFLASLGMTARDFFSILA